MPKTQSPQISKPAHEIEAASVDEATTGGLRSSLALKLVSAVLGIYFFIAISVTVIQLNMEYRNERNRFFTEIENVSLTLRPILSDAMWNLDSAQVESAVLGILGINHDIEQVRVLDQDGQLVFSADQPVTRKHFYVNEYLSGLFQDYVFTYELMYKTEYDGEQMLGKMEILSSSEVILNRAFYTFLITIFSAVFKTLFLSVIFFLILVRMVGKPLRSLKSLIQQLDPSHGANSDFSINSELLLREDELGAVVRSFDKMAKSLGEKERTLIAYKDHLEEKVHERTVQLEKAIDAKTEFLAAMSHEIRTPMNGVLGMSQLLADTPLTEKQLKYLSIIQGSSTSLIDIINGILDHLKIEAGKLELENTVFDLASLIDDSAGIFLYKSRENSVRLTPCVMSRCPTALIGDPTRIRQIVINLLGNAFKFTSQGEINLTVDKVRDIDDRYVLIRIEVQDSGCGIPKDKQKTLFTAFTQADSSTTRRYGGTGLGLTICRQLVELMQGEIGFDSEVGVGSTFWVELPLQLSHASATEDHKFNGMLHHLKGKTVLIVDDHIAFKEATKEMVKVWGMKTIAVSTAEATYAAFKDPEKNSIDIVLLDVELPDALGTEVAVKLKSLLGDSAPPIILTSAYQHFPHEWETRDTTVYSFLEKPISAKELSFTMTSIFSEAENHGDKSDRPLYKNYSHMKVLVAEDNQVNQIVISGFLNKLGVDPVIKSNGLQAIHEASSRPGYYDIILMDCEMPEVDGWEAAKQIRLQNYKNAKGDDVLIYALSAHAMERYVEKAKMSGMDGYIYKPVTIAQIVEIFDQVDARSS